MSWRFGGGRMGGGGGGATPEYGPIAGAQAIRDGTVPQAVVHPGGSPTVVNPGDNIATKITTAGAGGTLWFTKGQHNVSATLIPLSNQTWVLESIGGYTRTSTDSVILDGTGISSGSIISGSNPGITIRGGDIRNNPVSNGIFLSGGPAGTGLLIEDLIAHDNFNIGIAWARPNASIRRCYMHHNGAYGINGTVNNIGDVRYTGNVVTQCRWSVNNTRNLNPGADAGGSKFVWNDGLNVTQCWVHDNTGVGIWPDFLHRSMLISENVCENNSHSAIFYEASLGGTTIRRNYCKDNGYGTVAWPPIAMGWQINLACCDGTLGPGGGIFIDRNIVDSNSALGQGRLIGLIVHDNHPENTKAITVDNNQLWLRGNGTGRIGGVDEQAVKTLWTETSNAWTNNQYNVEDLGVSYWIWGSGTQTGVNFSWTSWEALAVTSGETRGLI